MAKKIIRETIIALLICLAILLVLNIALYNFIPANKVIPEVVEYQPSKEIQSQLNTSDEDNSEKITEKMTTHYKVTAQDLENYERTKEYKPGKANPFAATATEPVTNNGNQEPNNNTNTSNTTNTKPNNQNTTKPSNTTSSSNTNKTNTNSEGKLFEDSSSK